MPPKPKPSQKAKAKAEAAAREQAALSQRYGPLTVPSFVSSLSLFVRNSEQPTQELANSTLTDHTDHGTGAHRSFMDGGEPLSSVSKPPPPSGVITRNQSKAGTLGKISECTTPEEDDDVEHLTRNVRKNLTDTLGPATPGAFSVAEEQTLSNLDETLEAVKTMTDTVEDLSRRVSLGLHEPILSPHCDLDSTTFSFTPGVPGQPSLPAEDRPPSPHAVSPRRWPPPQ